MSDDDQLWMELRWGRNLLEGLPGSAGGGQLSLCTYALTQQPACDGETWGCALLKAPDGPQFGSDEGIAAVWPS